MLKKAILSITAFLCLGAFAQAQKCATDDFHKEMIKMHPEILQTEAALEKQIQDYMKKLDWNRLAKGTGIDTDTVQLHIPVVVHVIHNYGSEYVSDNQIYALVAHLNAIYNKKYADTALVIPLFKPYIGNMRITFHLATKDPQGQPTKGITRRYSYQALGGDEAAKFDQWPPTSYLNIWLQAFVGRSPANGIVIAYSNYPSAASSNPYTDGLISRADAITNSALAPNTIEHEIGHYLNLSHTWGNTNDAGVDCGDDGVDDTPPTKGHFSTCPLYDSACATGYFRNGINYPDTANVQNIMDYSSCTIMFTQGQGSRARAALRNTTAGRSNLWSPGNLAATGALAPIPDLAPVADFNPDKVFVCANGATPVTFTNRSWNDTVSSSAWTFSNGATPATSTSLTTAAVSFSQIGWVDVSLKATSNAGNNTITKEHVVYAADPATITPEGYYQEFDPNGDLDRYPIFNYYGTDHKWELLTNKGYYDNTSIRFTNFDVRQFAYANTQTYDPGGNYSDFFTRAFDLSQSTNTTNLNFMSAGAFRTVNTTEMNDTLEVSYSTNCGSGWFLLGRLTRQNLANNGYVSSFFVPGWDGAWKGNSFVLPSTARQARVFFRFRFKSGSDNAYYGYGTGNNFYIDRINITNNPLGVAAAALENKGMVLAPNPTSGSAMLTLKGGDNSLAQVSVSDITGKVVFRTEARLTNAATQIEIPANVIAAKGMYLVQAVTNGKAQTQKLVVY